MPDHLHALPPGHMLGEYRIDRVLGSGGFGITYYAWVMNLGKPVAIKEYLPDDFAVRNEAGTVQPKSSGHDADYRWGLERFLDEAQTLALFRHQHLNEVHSYFEGNGTAYMVLEYIDGETLSAVLQRDGRLAPERLRRLLDELLSGLDEVHRVGIVHRDVKPLNIMFRADGSSVLLDFGAARKPSKSATVILTRVYAPIEQYAQNAEGIGPWTDLYAVGMVAYRCLSGISESELPDAVTRARAGRKGGAGKDFPPAVEAGAGLYDGALLRAVDYAIRVDEEDRPRSVAEMRNALAGRTAPVLLPPLKTISKWGALMLLAGQNTTRQAKRLSAPLRNAILLAAQDATQRAKHLSAPLRSAMLLAAQDTARQVRWLVATLGVGGKDVEGLVGWIWVSSGYTPLHIAAVVNAGKAAALLLKNGANIAAKDAHGHTPLLYAVWGNADKTADLLLKNGANIAVKIKGDNTLLHITARQNADSIAAMLLKNGADIAAEDHRGYTPLHTAAEYDAGNTAALLLKEGASRSAYSQDGYTPLDVAKRKNSNKVLRLLQN